MRLNYLLAGLSLALFIQPGLSKDIYQCAGNGGMTVFSDQPCATASEPLTVRPNVIGRQPSVVAADDEGDGADMAGKESETDASMGIAPEAPATIEVTTDVEANSEAQASAEGR